MTRALGGSFAWLLLAGCAGSMGAAGYLPAQESGLSLQEVEAETREDATSPDGLVKQAAVYLEHGFTSRAGRLVRRALVRRPDHLGGLVVDARVAVLRGDLDRAWTRFDEALVLHPHEGVISAIAPEFVAVSIAFSERLREGRRAVEALRLLERLGEHLPGNQERLPLTVRSGLGEELVRVSALLMDGGLSELAERALLLAEERGVRTDLGDGGFVRAQLLVLRGTGGEEALTRWAAAGPAERWIRVARFYETAMERERVLSAYRSATQTDPTSAVAWRGLAQNCLVLEDIACAQEAFGRAAATYASPTARVEQLLQGARAMRDADGSAVALPLFEAALALAPDQWEVLEEATRALGQNMRHQAVERSLARYVQTSDDPDTALARSLDHLHAQSWHSSSLRLVELLEASSSPPPSLPLAAAQNLPPHPAHDAERQRLLHHYIASLDDELEAQLAVAELWLQVGRPGLARQSARRAQVLAPDHPEALLIEARCWSDEGDASRSNVALLRVRSNARKDLASAIALATLELEEGRPTRALDLLRAWESKKEARASRAYHRIRFRAALRSKSASAPDPSASMRAWVALAPERSRREALNEALLHAQGFSRLRTFRIDILTALLAYDHSAQVVREALAEELLQAGRVEEAVRVWEDVVRGADDENASALRAGRALDNAGHHEAAVQFLDRVAPTHIAEGRVHRRLAQFFTERGQVERADVHHELWFQSAKARRTPQGLQVYGDEMLRRRLPDRAREVIELRTQLRPKQRDALTDRVHVEILAGDDAAVDRAVEALMAITPDGARRHAWQTLANLFEREGRLERAVHAYESSLRLQRPGSQIGVFKRLARVYRRLGRATEILEAASWVLSHGGNAANVFTSVIEELEASGIHAEAATLLDQVLGEQVTDARLKQIALSVAVRRGDVETADRWASSLLVALGHRSETWTKVASIWSEAGYTKRAAKVLDRGAEAHPNDSSLLLAQGRARWIRGDRPGAESCFLKAVSHAAAPHEVTKQIAKWLRDDGLHDWLVTLLARVTAVVDPRHEPASLRIRAWLDTGDLPAAEAAISRYLGTDQREHVEVANLALNAGYPELALRHLQRALQRPQTGERGFPLSTYAKLLIEQGRASELPERLSDALSRTRDKGKVMLEVAQALIEYGRRSEALEWIERAERLRSQAQIAQVKANLLLELGEEARAADAFERFIRQQAVVGTSRRSALNGRQRQALTRAVAQVVQTYDGRGAYGAGARLVRRLRDGLGTDVNLVAQEARLLLRAGRLDEGLELLRDLRFGADDPSPMLGVWGGLTEALVDRGLRDEATRLLERVLGMKYQSDLARKHLRLLIEDRRGVRAWRAARVLMTRHGTDDAFSTMEMALGAGLPLLADRVARWIDSRGSVLMKRRAAAILDAHRRPRPDAAALGAPGEVATVDLLAQARERAQGAMQRGDFATAGRFALAALRLEVGDRSTQHLALRMTAASGDALGHQEALTLLVRATRGHTIAMEQATAALRASGLDTHAYAIQERMADIYPGRSRVVLEAVRLALECGQDQAAEEWTDVALERWGDEVGVRLGLSEIWYGYGVLDRAQELATFERELRGARAWPAARLRASIAWSLDDPERSLSALLEGVRHASAPAEASADALGLVDRWRGPEAWSTRLLSEVASDLRAAPRLLLARLRLAWASGDSQEGQELLDELLSNQALSAMGVADLMVLAARMGRPAVIERLIPVLSAQVGSPDARRVAGIRGVLALDRDQAGLGIGLSDEAKREMAKHVRSWLAGAIGHAHRPSAGLVSAVGRAHEVMGAWEAALAVYEDKALETPWEPSARNNWAYALAEMDAQLELALRLVRRAQIDHGEPLASFLDTEAWILHRMGRHEEALGLMRRALLHAVDAQHLSNEGRVEMMYHQGRILEAVVGSEKARVVFRACAKRAPEEPYGRRCAQALEAL